MTQRPRHPALHRLRSQDGQKIKPTPTLITPAASPKCSPKCSPHSSPQLSPRLTPQLAPQFSPEYSKDQREFNFVEYFKQLSSSNQISILEQLLENANREVLLGAKEAIEPKLRHDPFKTFPYELSLRVLSHLNKPETLAAAAQVSKLWYFLLSDDSTWKKLCENNHYRRLSAVKSYVHTWSKNTDVDGTVTRRRSARRASLLGDQPLTDPDDRCPLAIYGSRVLNNRDNTSNNSGLTDSPVVHFEHHPASSGDASGVANGTTGTGTSTGGGTEGSADTSRDSQSGSVTSRELQPPGGSQNNHPMMLRQSSSGLLNLIDGGASAETADPIVEAYYDPQSLEQPLPDSYRSYFRQEYLREQAWATGGRLAARYKLKQPVEATVTQVVSNSKYTVVALDTSLILVFTINGELVRSLYGHVMGVWALALYNTTLVSGGCDRDIREWDLENGTCRHILRGHNSTVRCLAMADEHTAVSGGRDAIIRVWDLKAGVCLHKLTDHVGSVRRLEVVEAFNKRLIVSASYDYTAKIWDLDSGELLHTLQGHSGQLYSLAVSKTLVATGSLDNTIKIWKLDTGELVSTLKGHASLVGQLQICGHKLVSASTDGSLRVWDLRSMECLLRIAAHDNTVTNLVVCNKHIISGGPDGRVLVFNLDTGEFIRQFHIAGMQTVWGISASDDRMAIVYSANSSIIIELISFVCK